jgi:hypothetical protein
MKNLNEIRNILSENIDCLKRRISYLGNDLNTLEDDYQKQFEILSLLKKSFYQIYVYQYEMTECLLLLKRLENYDENNYLDEIEYFIENYKRDLLQGNLMPSTTNMTYNITFIWELEVKQKMIRRLENLIK